MIKKSDLPFGSEFSPSQIALVRVLELADKEGGDWKAFENAIKQEYFHDYKTNDYNKGKLANNTKLGMIAYGLIERDATLTELGRTLLSMRADENLLYTTFARHILLNLFGMSLVQCIQDMTASGEQVNLTSLREALGTRGVHYPPGGKHPSMMRLWLAKAGVFIGTRWQVDEICLKKVLGIDSNDFGVLADLTSEQRAFVRALANTDLRTPQPANLVARLASVTYGVKFPEKSLPKLVLNKLVDSGYISVEKTTTGRGAKPFLVSPTEKLIASIVNPLLEQLDKQIDPELRNFLRKSLPEITNELKSSNKHIAGLALEALGFKLMRLIDIDYIATRLRGQTTGGAEVDLIFESKRLIYSRWQIQCKNTGRVSLDDVAKEMGLTHFLKSSVIIMVSTGEIGSEARRYANKIMAESNIAIVMIDGSDLKKINIQPTMIVDVFEREAHHAMKLKTLDLEK